MVSGGRSNDPSGLLFAAQVGYPIVGTTDLEGKNRLQVFTLEKYAVAEHMGQEGRFLERRLDSRFINLGGKNLFESVFAFSRSSGSSGNDASQCAE